MAFPWTLQKYIFRELGKSFALAAVGLTITLSLGGGVLNIARMGEVTPGQLVRLLLLIVPVALAFTLPVAALFSSAATYGRLASDNEFVACRSSGINLHLLFAPTLVLSGFSAAVAFGFSNFLIPGMVRNLDEFLSADLGRYIEGQLAKPRGLTIGKKYRIHADESELDPGEPNRVVLRGVAFIEADQREWIRFGTANGVELRFDREDEKALATASMLDLTYFDRRKGQFLDLGRQVIPPQQVPTLFAQEIKYLTLGELIQYAASPEEWFDAARALRAVRAELGKRRFFAGVVADYLDNDTDRTVRIRGGEVSWTIRADRMLELPGGQGLELEGVTIEEVDRGRQRSVKAERADIEVRAAEDLAQSGVVINAVVVEMELAGQRVDRERITLGPALLPQGLLDELLAMPDSQVLSGGDDGGSVPAADDPLAAARTEAVAARGETIRRIYSTLSERLAFSASIFVLVLLAAALGILFRGSQALVAFGISFVPSLAVIITIVMGRQIAQNEGTFLAGIGLMWLGIALVTLLDVYVMTRRLRR